MAKLYRLPLKLRVLIALNNNNPSGLKDIQKITNTKAQNLCPALRELCRQGVVKKLRRGQYGLSVRGKLIAAKMAETFEYIDFLDDNKNFFDSRCLESLPRKFLDDFAVFRYSTLIDNKINPQRAIYHISEMFTREEEFILGASPVITMEWSMAITHAAKRGVDVKLITPEFVLKEILRDEFIKNTRTFFTLPNTEWFVNPHLKFGIGVTSRYVVLGFFTNKGEFDPFEYLYSDNKEAIRWGVRLFNEIKSMSRKIEMKELPLP
ncbi:helix-turn-helix transcriptional regulator [Candidatus Pyrohabitans sp.]